MRLNWVKGLEPFMEIVAKSGCRDKVQLAVAGNGELKEHLLERSKTLPIDLKLLGYHEEADIIELYQAADCFFMSSLSDPSPLTCVEALWCGLPLFISEYVGNYPEVVRQGINGYVYSYQSSEKAIFLLEELFNNDSNWFKRARVESKNIAKDSFELQKTTKELLKKMQ